MIIHDTKGFLYVNYILANMIGYEVVEVIGKDSFALFTPESQQLIKKILCGVLKKLMKALYSRKMVLLFL